MLFIEPGARSRSRKPFAFTQPDTLLSMTVREERGLTPKTMQRERRSEDRAPYLGSASTLL